MCSKGRLRPMCPLWAFLQGCASYVLSLYSLRVAALLRGYLLRLGARAERGGLRVPYWETLVGVSFVQVRPLLPMLGHCRHAREDRWPRYPHLLPAFLLCFEVSSLEKLLLERAHFIVGLLSILVAQSTFLRRLPRNGMC